MRYSGALHARELGERKAKFVEDCQTGRIPIVSALLFTLRPPSLITLITTAAPSLLQTFPASGLNLELHVPRRSSTAATDLPSSSSSNDNDFVRVEENVPEVSQNDLCRIVRNSMTIAVIRCASIDCQWRRVTSRVISGAHLLQNDPQWGLRAMEGGRLTVRVWPAKASSNTTSSMHRYANIFEILNLFDTMHPHFPLSQEEERRLRSEVVALGDRFRILQEQLAVATAHTEVSDVSTGHRDRMANQNGVERTAVRLLGAR